MADDTNPFRRKLNRLQERETITLGDDFRELETKNYSIISRN